MLPWRCHGCPLSNRHSWRVSGQEHQSRGLLHRQFLIRSKPSLNSLSSPPNLEYEVHRGGRGSVRHVTKISLRAKTGRTSVNSIHCPRQLAAEIPHDQCLNLTSTQRTLLTVIVIVKWKKVVQANITLITLNVKGELIKAVSTVWQGALTLCWLRLQGAKLSYMLTPGLHPD